MRKINLAYLFGLMLVMLGIVQGCRKEMVDMPRVPLSDEELLAKAKDWHFQNTELLRGKGQANADMDISDLVFRWDDYSLSENKVGNQVITVPIVSKGASKAYYIELGLIVDDRGRARGMIKEYMRSPYTGKTPMHLYTGTGRMFLSGVYEARKQKLLVTKKSGSGIYRIEKLATIASSGSSGSNPEEPLDGGEIEEVVVPPPGGGDDGGGGGSVWDDDDDNGGGDNGGGSGGVPTNPGNNPKQAKQTIVNTTSRSDCDAIELAQDLASKSAIQNAINEIKNKNKEWAVPLQLTDPEDGNTLITGTAYSSNKCQLESSFHRFHSCIHR